MPAPSSSSSLPSSAPTGPHAAPEAEPSSSWPRPGLPARLWFGYLRHRVAVTAVLTGVIVGTGLAALLVAISSGDIRSGLAVALWSCAAGVVVLNLSLLLVWRDPPAGPRLIAAALGTATPNERPHLLARLGQRLAQRYCPEPITGSELAALFNAVRAEHGTRAKASAERTAAALARQQALLEEAGRE